MHEYAMSEREKKQIVQIQLLGIIGKEKLKQYGLMMDWKRLKGSLRE